MSERQVFFLVHQQARERAVAAVKAAPDGRMVVLQDLPKSRLQENTYHDMIGDFAGQYAFMGRRWHKNDMKVFLLDAFARVMREIGTPLTQESEAGYQRSEIYPSLDGKGVVQIGGIRSSKFTVPEAVQFITYLHAYGIEKSIVFNKKEMFPS